MGSGEVVSTIIEWAAKALHDNPLLVAPTLLLALAFVGLAVFEAITVTVQIAALLVRHYRHRLSELGQAGQELRDAISPKKKPSLQLAESDSARSNVVQKDRLAQQRLFDRQSR
jgi:hypothetical protein